MMQAILFVYLVAAVCFILALRGLSSPETARHGNRIGIAGMILAVAATLCLPSKEETTFFATYGYLFVAVFVGGIVGTVIARKIHMTALPQLIAAFHSLVGLAAVLVAWASFTAPDAYGIGTKGAIKSASLIEMSLGVLIGAVTFSGSLIAWAKLQGILSGKPLRFRLQHSLNAVLAGLSVVAVIVFAAGESPVVLAVLTVFSLLLGFLLILPIGGADMPVVVSMLNSYSGWAAAGIGFTLQNSLLIITGALVGASGAILSYIMCKAMNRSILNVILGGFGATTTTSDDNNDDEKTVNIGSVEDAVFLLKNAAKVIIVPGYGMAVAQAQHALRDMGDALKKEGVEVLYAIHPVAGRMPGHMNVLLAEANVPYEDVFELDDINHAFSTTDVVYIIGANDITNPLAKTMPESPIYGMPVLDVDKAKTVICVKRSLGGTGYSGIDNPLFYMQNTMMLLGDAKKVTENIVKTLEEN